MRLASVSTSSLIGVAIACSGNVLISLALTVQKLAHRRQSEELAASRSASSSGNATPDEPTQDGEAESEQRSQPEGTKIPVLVVPPSSDLVTSLNSPERQVVGPGQYGAIETQKAGSSSLDPVPEHDRLTSRTNPSNHGRRSPSPARIKTPPAFKSNIQIIDSRQPGSGNAAHASSRKPGDEETNDEDSDEDKQKDGDMQVKEGSYLKSKLWWLGLGLIAIGEGGNFLSYGFAPASVVAPLGTVALIANCIFAPLILRETFHAKELIGMALAILGAVTVVWSSKASNPRLDPDSLVHAIKQIPFIVYTSINFALVILLMLLSQHHRLGSKYIAIDIGVCALFGGYTVLSTKALSSLLSTMFVGAFQYMITWVLVLVLILTSILQVKYLNRALMRFQSKEVIPTQFVFFSMAAIIGSAVLYQEFRDVSFSNFVNFAFGIATTFLGVHLLTSYSQEEPEGSHDDGESNSPSHPPAPQRATSSASLNLLLPTTSRLSERTPLLIPVAVSPESANLPALGGSGSYKGRLLKRTSTGDFTPHLGLSSQAGFLLMATTPPNIPPGLLSNRRERSSSRSQVPQSVDVERSGKSDGRRGTVS